MKKINQWRDNKVAHGWKIVYRVVPAELCVEINKLIARHKADHYDAWATVAIESAEK